MEILVFLGILSIVLIITSIANLFAKRSKRKKLERIFNNSLIEGMYAGLHCNQCGKESEDVGFTQDNRNRFNNH